MKTLINDSITILVLDNEQQFRQTLSKALKDNEQRVIEIANQSALAAAIAVHRPDLILLNLMVGSAPDGIEVCSQLRRWSCTPVIFFSAINDACTRIDALNAGADDFMTKPFSVDELLARVRAVMRRVEGCFDSTSPVLKINDLVIDLVARRATLTGQPIFLTEQEYTILRTVALAQGQIVTYAELWHVLWNRPDTGKYVGLRSIVKSLQLKLNGNSDDRTYIVTEGAMGCRMKRTQLADAASTGVFPSR